jgi:hypothetical protein
MAKFRHSRRTSWRLILPLAALVVVTMVVIPTLALAGDDAAEHDMAAHDAAALHDEVGQVRRVTARFHDVDAALEAGYELGWVNGSGTRIISGCVAHATAGAMGYHYFNRELMDDLAVDVLQPEVLVYESRPDGSRKLVAVEWVARGPNSNPPGVTEPPSVLGMPMHILVPAVGFYIMHAWVWKPNPSGIFTDWNPEVSCP